MRIEIWADLICPWCGLGQHRLDRAIESFPRRDEIELVHHAFQLDPRAPEEPRTARAMLRDKGLTDPQIDATWSRIQTMAALDGLSPYLLDNTVGNTRRAHELLALAADRGVGAAAWKHVYRAYFGERRPIFSIDDLVTLGGEIGLDPAEVRASLTEERFRPQVEADIRQAHALGITGVPFVLVDRKLAVSGAQPLEVFRQALARAAA